jgi:hypothetical protein
MHTDNSTAASCLTTTQARIIVDRSSDFLVFLTTRSPRTQTAQDVGTQGIRSMRQHFFGESGREIGGLA